MKVKISLSSALVGAFLFLSVPAYPQNPSYKVSMGSYIQVSPADLVGFGGEQFSSKISPFAYYNNLKGGTKSDIKCPLKGILGKSGSASYILWDKKISLYEKKKFQANSPSADILESNIFVPFTSYLLLKTKSENKADSPFSVNYSVQTVPPQIEGIYNSSGTARISFSQPASEILVKGTFFGSHKPSVWLEHVRNGKVHKTKCKVLDASMIYQDFNKKPSAMDCDVASPNYGLSQILLKLPSKWPSGWEDSDLHDLVLDNGLGRASIPFGSADPSEPGQYVVPQDFIYALQQNVSASPIIADANGNVLAKMRVDVFNENPEAGGTLIASFQTDQNGVLPLEIQVPSQLKKLFLALNYVGLSGNLWYEIASGKLSPAPLIGSGDYLADTLMGGAESGASLKSAATYGKYYFPDNYNSQGVPDSRIVPRDSLSADFLAKINASLPEYRPVPLYHPDYLDSKLELNTILIEEADVWVTFVHEGANYKNFLGFYTYNRNSPPQSKAGIEKFTVVFPNASFNGSGGGLYSGDKVYIGRFPADTVIGYFLIPNGWLANKNSLAQNTAYFSNSAFNPETDESLRQHVILLWDEDSNKTLLGFEDLSREYHACDNDFNDAVFYISANPPEAVENTNVAEIDTPKDKDGDGVSDLFDDYPDDPLRAFKNYYPAEGEYATMAYEDMWPLLGDYDFNDLVLRYSFSYSTNTKAQMLDFEAEFIIVAVGAERSNGFAFSTPFLPSDVKTVAGQRLSHGYITLNQNGTEAAQSKAVIPVCDNVFDLISRPPGHHINTDLSAPYVEPVSIKISVTLKNPQSASSSGPASFNHFLIVNQDRGYEVHVPGKAPTDLADDSLFGTGDDDSNPSTGRYYVSKSVLPWALDLPNSWNYPYEKNRINRAFNRFSVWSQSGGKSFSDWYEFPILAEIYVKPAQ